MSNHITIVAIIVASATIYCLLKNWGNRPNSLAGAKNNTIKENYDPQDMGGRNYWGFGREYGYPQRDMDYVQPICYQISPRHLCREGYSRKINSITLGDECCVNNYVYQ